MKKTKKYNGLERLLFVMITLCCIIVNVCIGVIPANYMKAEASEPTSGYSYINSSPGESVETRYSDNMSYSIYTNHYFYDNMDASEKKIWDMLYECCEDILLEKKDPVYKKIHWYATDEDIYYYGTDSFQYPQDASTNVRDFTTAFCSCNPQFYFLSGMCVVPEDHSGCFLEIYNDFGNREDRKIATKKMFTIVDSMVNEIEKEQKEYDKVKKTHDILCNTVDYDYNVEFDQSCYAAFVKGKAICTGYSKSFALLLNRVGIPTLTITSSDHMYNEVRIDGKWYMVDVEYDVIGNTDLYFLKSDKSFQGPTSMTSKAHTQNAMWTRWGRPICEEDYVVGVEPQHNDENETQDKDNETHASSQMHRLYNKYTGEHFYTASAEEKNNLRDLGWEYEGEAWEAPESSGTPVYRLYNPNNGDHHYTPNTAERDMLASNGWKYESIGWYSDDNQSVPLYRLYNPNTTGAGSHHYTMSEGERDNLVAAGWKYEGIGWYGL